ncbi:MAG: hypothetical protein WAN75_43385, partial [Xanthobacteraceae bacterium]
GCSGTTYGGRMTISTLLLILLLTFGAASSLDRFVRSHWLHEVLTRAGLWGRDTGLERARY